MQEGSRLHFEAEYDLTLLLARITEGKMSIHMGESLAMFDG
jgi:hypothetical protein